MPLTVFLLYNVNVVDKVLAFGIGVNADLMSDLKYLGQEEFLIQSGFGVITLDPVDEKTLGIERYIYEKE